MSRNSCRVGVTVILLVVIAQVLAGCGSTQQRNGVPHESLSVIRAVWTTPSSHELLLSVIENTYDQKSPCWIRYKPSLRVQGSIWTITLRAHGISLPPSHKGIAYACNANALDTVQILHFSQRYRGQHLVDGSTTKPITVEGELFPRKLGKRLILAQ